MTLKVIFDNEDDMSVKINDVMRLGDMNIPSPIRDIYTDFKLNIFKQLSQMRTNSNEDRTFFNLYGCSVKDMKIEKDGSINIDLNFQYCD